MISAFDKEIKRSLKDCGNDLSLYEDRPTNWDAWDIDFFYRDVLETAVASSSLQPYQVKYIQTNRILLLHWSFKIVSENCIATRIKAN